MNDMKILIMRIHMTSKTLNTPNTSNNLPQVRCLQFILKENINETFNGVFFLKQGY